jgi:hypothetical protein
MHPAISNRLRHACDLVLRRSWLLAALIVLGVVGGLLTWRDQLVPGDVRARLGLLNMLPRWSWAWWVLAVALLTLALVVESSFCTKRRLELEQERIHQELRTFGPENCLSIDRISLNTISIRDLEFFEGIHIAFRNISAADITFKLTVRSVTINGIALALPDDASLDGVAQAGRESPFDVTFIAGLFLFSLNRIVIEFDIQYDNMPALLSRALKRKMLYRVNNIDKKQHSIDILESVDMFGAIHLRSRATV